MGAIAPINFEDGLIAPIDFRWKQGLKGNLHPSIENPNGLLSILHPSIEIPNDAPVTSPASSSRLRYCLVERRN